MAMLGLHQESRPGRQGNGQRQPFLLLEALPLMQSAVVCRAGSGHGIVFLLQEEFQGHDRVNTWCEVGTGGVNIQEVNNDII